MTNDRTARILRNAAIIQARETPKRERDLDLKAPRQALGGDSLTDRVRSTSDRMWLVLSESERLILQAQTPLKPSCINELVFLGVDPSGFH